MKKISLPTCIVLTLILIVSIPLTAGASFRIAIMQERKGAAADFRPLLDYLEKNGTPATFVSAVSYPHAARMFADGSVDGMFSGSGVAGCMIIKDLARPVVRPVNAEGWSTYRAVVIAPEGSPRFVQNPDYFEGKRVICCGLASSGEFYFRSIMGGDFRGATLLMAASHWAAVDALSRGAADVAIVKDRVWDKVKSNYGTLVRVGEDPGENPDGTLIVSKTTDPKTVEGISTLLLGIESDPSPEAAAVKKALNIRGYLPTTVEDFKTTIRILRQAGVDKDFDFAF